MIVNINGKEYKVEQCDECGVCVEHLEQCSYCMNRVCGDCYEGDVTVWIDGEDTNVCVSCFLDIFHPCEICGRYVDDIEDINNQLLCIKCRAQ